jgi:hypothetical protein
MYAMLPSTNRSNSAARIAIALTALVCAAALRLNVYPGALEDFSFAGICLFIALAPLAAVAGFVWLAVLARQGKLKAALPSWRTSGIVLGIIVVTCALIALDVPRRIAFAASRTEFEPLLARAGVSDYQGTALDRQLGLYRVDRFAADPRGGIYFRVATGRDGLGPDVMSYGFAYRPNPQGTPFGAAHYAFHSLRDEWYWFCASAN